MKRILILSAICLLPVLSIGQVYISQVLEGFTFVGPANIEESVAVSQSYSAHLLITEKLLKEMQIQNEVLIDELKNKKTLRRRDKQQIKDAQIKKELTENELLIIRVFQHKWAIRSHSNYQLSKLFDHLQNGQCATIFTSTDTLFVEDYEIRTDEIDTVTELIPVEKRKEQVWKKIEQDGKRIWCLMEKKAYYLNNYGAEMEINKCPTDFAFSNNKQYCQRKSPLNFYEKPLVIRIFNKKTEKEVVMESWQVSDCQ